MQESQALSVNLVCQVRPRDAPRSLDQQMEWKYFREGRKGVRPSEATGIVLVPRTRAASAWSMRVSGDKVLVIYGLRKFKSIFK